ncbi:MAG: AsmA-like C-terminal region-containing protein [Pseudomonadota bacterium]
MRVLIKIIAAVVLFFGVLLIAGYVFVLTVNVENHYDRAESWIQKTYDVQMAFAGDSNLSWSGLAPALKIDTVTYGEPVRVTGKAVKMSLDNLLKLRSAMKSNKNFDVAFTAERIEMDSVALHQVDLPLRIGDVSKTTSPLSARFYDGDLSGDIQIDGSSLSFDGNLEQVDVSQFVSSFNFDINASAYLNGQLGPDFVNTLEGEVILRSYGGALAGNQVNRWAGDVLLNLLPGDHQKTEIDCISAPFKIQNGIAHTDAIVINTDVAVIVGQGRVNLTSGTLDFEFTPKPRDPSLVNLATPITVTGNITDPAVSVSEMGVLRKLGGLVATAINPAAFLFTFSTLGTAPEDEKCFEDARTILEEE